MIKHDIEPNTPEWLELRKGYRTASEAAIVLDISPFQTPQRFKMVKAGLARQFYSKAMQLGHEKEAMIRAWSEQRLGKQFFEEVWTRDNYLASLDGRSTDGVVLEIKCSSHTYNTLSNGDMPEHYLSQIQQQMYCSGSETAYLVAWCPKSDQYAISEVINFDPSFMSRIEAAWEAFDAMPLPEGDVNADDNQTLERLFHEYEAIKTQRDQIDDKLSEVKEQILEFSAEGRAVNCRGYRINYVKPRTTIDYKKATKGLDLEPYTKVAASGTYSLKMAPSAFEVEDAE